VRAAEGFGGLLNTFTQEHTTFAKEFSDRVRVVSCLNNLPNIVTSDTRGRLAYGAGLGEAAQAHAGR
jgi:hypothetical protein